MKNREPRFITQGPWLTDQHIDFRKKVRSFAEEIIYPAAFEYDREERFPQEVVEAIGAQGWLAINGPKEFGGHGADFMSFVVLVEELARVDGSMAGTVAAHNSLGVNLLNTFGTEEQRRQWLPGLCTGKQLWAFGLTEENAGSDSRGTETFAEIIDNQWVINGSKLFISNASNPMTAGVTIQAITKVDGNKKELSAFIVPFNSPGLTATRMRNKLMWRGADTATLELKGVTVPLENIIGAPGDGPRITLGALDNGRLTIAAMGLGLAQGAFEAARKHALSRKQFGKAIGEFQAIGFKLADMQMKINHARAHLYQSVWLKENNLPFANEAAISKLYCSEVAKEVADEAVQILGGRGLLKDSHVERFFRDQRILQIGEGTSEVLRLVISRKILKEE